MKCSVRLISNQTDLLSSSFFESLSDEYDFDVDFHKLEEPTNIESMHEGKLVIKGDNVEVRFVDSVSKNNDTKSIVRFNKKNPDEVVVSREGALNSTMFFTKGKRNISVYDTGIIPFEICIFTKSIDNQLLEKGYIEIVYYVELKGASVQQNSLRMEIKKND